jgi:hypothetical protein
MLPLASQTADQTAPAQLAARISSLLPRRATVSIETQNLTELPAAGWSSFRSRLLEELGLLGVKTAGVETAGTPLEARVRVTLSEDSRGLLLLAEVFSGGVSAGDNRQVAMLRWNPPTMAPAKPPVALSRSALWAQAEPILDVLLADSGSQMLILGENQVQSYRQLEGKWTLVATASLVLPRPMPRDPRGRLEVTPAGFRAYLPVGSCDGTVQPELSVACSSKIETWQSAPVHWVAGRNVLESDAPAPNFEGWGSDTASVADPCGAGNVIVADSPNNEHDSVRAYAVASGQATPASDALPLPGPVTALWPAESGREAMFVVHNLQTGEYEASRLGVACSR